ncbi:hypothetical protein NDU88_010761 [Pleurodeles waltl]|uniref:Uncharacterized protein n=1 Tax=Pleurodeles waltl TaxID=8319 RepID=A0AAV7S2B1_PLEWA|nr:hypothetical protein NDU88_010761 [Pleurodeles waltl]
MFDNFSVARLSHCVTSGPRKNYQTFTARHSGAARCRLIHGPAPVRGPGVGEHCSKGHRETKKHLLLADKIKNNMAIRGARAKYNSVVMKVQRKWDEANWKDLVEVGTRKDSAVFWKIAAHSSKDTCVHTDHHVDPATWTRHFFELYAHADQLYHGQIGQVIVW